MAGNVRKLEDVENMITLAKLDKDDLKPLTQSLVFEDKLSPDDFYLMELSPQLLASLADGQTLVIRGEKEETAVLCTVDCTFEMKDAETSNSLMLLPELIMPVGVDNAAEKELQFRPVKGVFHSYAELRPCKPKIKKLRQVLMENLYQGPEYDAENVGKKYTSEDLLDIIQASEVELNAALKKLPAFCINGSWRMLEFDYQYRIFSFILDFVDSNSLPIDQVPKALVLDTLQELVPRDILEQCFEMYAEPLTKGDDDDLYQLKGKDICRVYAEVLLRSAGKFSLQEFEEAWQRSVPEGMQTNLSQLEGLALVDRKSKPEVIFLFPAWDLPEDINERFITLFKMREKWTFNDIHPYIQDLSSDNMSANALLTKHARTSTQNGVKYYNSKYNRT